MNLDQKIKAKAKADREKIEKIKKWDARIKKLATRKIEPLSEAQFCRKHQITHGRFNRMKNLKDNNLPSDRLINEIENAFKNEGV